MKTYAKKLTELTEKKKKKNPEECKSFRRSGPSSRQNAVA